MTIEEKLLLVADALVSIVEFECCDYGFTDAVDLAYLILGNQTDGTDNHDKYGRGKE